MSESIAHTSMRKVRTSIASTTALLLVTIVHWVAVASLVLADQPNKQARQKVNEGLEQYSSGNYEQATKSFAEAAQAAPDNPIIKFDEACAVSAAGDDDKARELLLQASVSSDPQVSAAACYNLAAIAAKRGRKELGEDPMAAAPEVRQAALDKLKIAVTHYRDCLRVAPEHPDARHNLELVLTLTNYLQQQWQIRDHQQALEKMSLFELLRHLDDQQLSLRSTTFPYKGQSATKVSQFNRSKMATEQLKLLDDIPTLKSKIDAQLANNPGESATTPNGTPSTEPSKQSEVEAQLRKMVTEQLDQANQALRQAAEDVRAANWDRALERQRFTNDSFRRLQELFSAFPENLDLAIELQESLIETNEGATPRSTTSKPAKAAKRDNSTDGQAWQQDWVSNFSQSLAAKASATLQSMPADVSESLPESLPESQLEDPPVKDLPKSENKIDSNEASQAETTSQTQTEATEVKTPELAPGEGSGLTPEQQQLKQQEEFAKQLRKALERTTELAPTILERSNEAKRLIVDSQRSAARPAQDDVLRMLKEIRDLLPKQPNQGQDKNQDKDQNQNQDQNQDKDQDKTQDNDQKDSDQQKQNEKKDSKSEDQKQNSENGQDKEQDKSQNSDKSDQKDDGDKSQPEKKPDTEKPQTKDKSEEAAKKSAAEQTKEQEKEQAAKESQKANPDNKAAEQTAQQIAEQRAQAVLRRIREREAKYRELLQQLRERQAQQTPVEKDW